MNTLEQIRVSKAVTLLTSYLRTIPELEFTSTINSITVPASDSQGFTVKFEINDSERFEVSYNEWKRRFKNEGEAVFFFMKGLTPESRLKIEISNDRGITHTAEHHSDRTWHSEGAKTILGHRICLLEKEQTSYLQNTHHIGIMV